MTTRNHKARNDGSMKATAVAACPHSWDNENWPEAVWPHTPSRARYIVRMHKTSLIEAGALARVGREFVFIGAAYNRWLQKQTTRAAVYDIAPNRASRTEVEAA